MRNVDFASRMAKVPDEELWLVLSSDGFLPEAVVAAKAELERRNLRPDDLARVTADVEAYQRVEQGKPSVPLSTRGKIAFFLFGPVLFWTVLAALVLRYRGYTRKSNEGFKWMAVGFVFWTAIGFLITAVP